LAEDVVQETFLKVMGGAASYRPQGNERAWVLRIAHNTTIDITRRERQTSQLIDNSADDESGFQETDVGLDFLKATEHLSERDRSIVILKVFSMLSHAEIAKTVNMTEGAVRVRYRRILNRLRNFYEQKE
jgi:RNA polymerase sigma-70 factor (ECF subfamily)